MDMGNATDKLDYPGDAAQVRDLIREYLKPQVDHGSSMDGGGGLGSADLWLTLGGVEYIVTVKRPTRSNISFPSISDEEVERALEEQRRLLKGVRHDGNEDGA
jgi:hypothetical protein